MAKTLIAYFSHAGQNYSHGSIRDLPEGNTEVVAKKIHALINSDLFFIDTVRKYPDDHMKKIEIAKREYSENARPELTARVENIDEQHHPGVVRLSDFRNRDFPAQPVSPAEHLPAESGLTRPAERHNM
ncbi:MAG: hypothetical protein IKE24_07605 [Clostridia bacterium]|nr:hypothetical protein [Clostridia bacterium]